MFKHNYISVDLLFTLMPHALPCSWVQLWYSSLFDGFLLPLVLQRFNSVLMFLLISLALVEWVENTMCCIAQLESTRCLCTVFVSGCHGFLRWPQHPGTWFWLLAVLFVPLSQLSALCYDCMIVLESTVSKWQNNDTVGFGHDSRHGVVEVCAPI